MTTERLRYVIEKQNRNGTVRHYWQRKGHAIQRLPADPIMRFAEAKRLNDEADKQGTVAAFPYGSVGWLISEYRLTDEFQSLAAETARNYQRWLKRYEDLWRHLPIKSITRRVVLETLKKANGGPSTKKHAAAVLANLFELARYYGLVETNPAHRLRLKSTRKRTEVWTESDAEAFLDACMDEIEGDGARLAFTLLLYTAQRPGDILLKGKQPGMGWHQYNGDTLKLRQQKTGKLIEVPCHSMLRAALDAAKASTQSTLIVTKRNGRPLTYQNFQTISKRIKRKLGLEHLQTRDLRRTAVVRMAEAGATIPEISAVTGHSVERTHAILEHYLPRNVAMARAGIAKIENQRATRV